MFNGASRTTLTHVILRDGLLHDLFEPSFYNASGTAVFMRKGLYHRCDGPAVVNHLDTEGEYYLKDVEHTLAEFEEATM